MVRPMNRMHLPTHWRLGAALALVALILSGCGRDVGRPHIVLIILDMLRADRLGAYGFEAKTSPELDALAADGVRFVQVISQSPWTRPSIA